MPDTALRPFKENTCPHCGGVAPTLDFCDAPCHPGLQWRGSPREIAEDAATFGERSSPHLHKTCNQCRFEWLSECKPERVA